MLPVVSRVQLLSDDQWALIEDLLPVRTGERGRPFSDARAMVEGIIYRYRCGIPWRDVPAVFGPWQTI
ncbi:transposase [Amycolatopsis australiensis]|uniref:transposase n=1 Tax=Amycolatopsis australiensis TaxID=546364 RepID=UPI000AB2F341|nr:transposase [Amycolatopsis australiensis]